jgi:uncharacterized protein (DUF58 family)
MGRDKYTTLEYAVKIAASVATYALDRGHALQLIGVGSRLHRLPPGRGAQHFAAVLTELARVNADGTTPYAEALSQSANFLSEGSTVVFLPTHEDTTSCDLTHPLGLLEIKRIRPICILLDGPSFTNRGPSARVRSHPLIRHATRQGMPTYLVAKGDDLQAVFAV